MTTSVFLEKGNPELQDRANVLNLGSRTVFIIADGAGGISGGTEAAEHFICLASESAGELKTAEDCQQLLHDLDQKLCRTENCGETTGIVAVLGQGELFGASVGDSAAWLFDAETPELLTMGPRKPFLGSGSAWAFPFIKECSKGTLVVATDGLWKYTSLELITGKVRTGSPAALAPELADLVRLRSGTFPDDIAIVTGQIG